MTTWHTDELNRIASVEEVHIAPRRGDGNLRRPTTVWVVLDGDNLFVRSWRGDQGSWWRAAHSIARAGP